MNRLMLGLAALLCGGQVVWGGMNLKEGDFVYGFYSAENQNDRNFQWIKESGVTHVHTYATGSTREKDRKFLDLAHKYGLKVMFDVTDNYRIFKKDNPFGPDFISMIDEFKKHPALDMWYICDEPNTTEMHTKVKDLHTVLKKQTPEIPTGLALTWDSNWRLFHDVCDIQLLDIYPIKHQKFPETDLQNYSNFIAAGFMPDKRKQPKPPTIFGVIQSSSWEAYRDQLKPGTVPEGEKCRFPNAQEMRYMGFSSVALGVRGLWFFAFYQMLRDQPGWLKEVFNPFLQENKAFTSEVGRTWEVTAIDRQFNKQQKVELAFWQRGDRRYLVLCNQSKTPRKLVLTLSDGFPRNGTLLPWGGTAQTPAVLREGVLTVKAEPWEVFVWTIR